uniref:Immunoglobulin domain-containing protein n=1 Tax=Bos indicus x Bos taurus TaxID=30522 RepID=A0A4W2GJT9_BOBOX
MSMVPPSLLCLGNLPPPRITALPGSTVPAKSHVTLLCQGPKQAEGYRISRVGSPEPMYEEEEITSRKTNALNFTEVTTDKTGLYHCSYQRGGRWSQFSDPLQLVMTGAFSKPSLSSMAGTVVAPGETVKLQCVSKINHDVFILTKEDGDHVTQNQSSVPHDGGRQTIFLLNPVSSTQAGTYRCYGAFREYPYMWSQPSDPLQLQVEGTTDSPSITQPRHSTAPTAWHPSVETQVRLSLAALLLLVMVVLLAEAWCSRGGGRWGGVPQRSQMSPRPSGLTSADDPPLASKHCAHLWGWRFQGPGWVTHPMQQCTRFLSNLNNIPEAPWTRAAQCEFSFSSREQKSKPCPQACTTCYFPVGVLAFSSF